MIIRKYGIELRQLSLDSIELLRQWRNADRIRCFMEYKEVISGEQQLTWFNALDPKTDFYFIIHYNDQPIGMIHTSGINWSAKTANAGLFIYEEAFMGSSVPVFASLTMVDVFFEVLGLEKYYAKVSADNKVAMDYNKSLGFEVVEGSAHNGFLKLELTKEGYVIKSKKWHELAKGVAVDTGELSISSERKEVLDSLTHIDMSSSFSITERTIAYRE